MGEVYCRSKPVAFRIAQATNEPVVMVATSDLHNKVKLNRWNNGKLIIEISEPHALNEDQDAKYWAQYFHQQMQQSLDRINAEVTGEGKVQSRALGNS